MIPVGAVWLSTSFTPQNAAGNSFFLTNLIDSTIGRSEGELPTLIPTWGCFINLGPTVYFIDTHREHLASVN